MSIHAIKWAWSKQCPSPTAKLVLVALADHANADGECWPTMKSVAELAGVSPRTVHDHIKALEDAGLLERIGRRKHRGEFRGWTFRLPVTDSASGSTPPVADDRQWQDTTSASGSQLPVPVAASFRSGTPSEPPGEPSVPPSSTDVDRFDEFWEAYPSRNGKKLHKGKAETQWKAKVADGEEEAAIIGAKHYAEAYEAGLPGVGAMDAFRWLRDRCWPDWQEPAELPNTRRSIEDDWADAQSGRVQL